MRRTLEEPNADAEPLELFDDQHLVGVDAREPVGAQADHAVERAGLGGVAEAVERRAVQPRAGVAVVDELLDHLVAVGSAAARSASSCELIVPAPCWRSVERARRARPSLAHHPQTLSL